MDTKNDGLELEVRSQTELGIPARVLERATSMLRAVIERSGASGSWLFRVTGECDSLEAPSQYRMRIDGTTRLNGMVHVVLRSSVMSGGAIAGMLQLPSGVSRDGYVGVLEPIIASLNQSRWGEVLGAEERGSMMPGQSGWVVDRRGRAQPRERVTVVCPKVSEPELQIISNEQALAVLDVIQHKLTRAVAVARRRGQDVGKSRQKHEAFMELARELRAVLSR